MASHRVTIHTERGVFKVCEISDFAYRHGVAKGNIESVAIGLLGRATADSSADGKEAHVPTCIQPSCEQCDLAALWESEVNRRRSSQNG